MCIKDFFRNGLAANFIFRETFAISSSKNRRVFSSRGNVDRTSSIPDSEKTSCTLDAAKVAASSYDDHVEFALHAIKKKERKKKNMYIYFAFIARIRCR